MNLFLTSIYLVTLLLGFQANAELVGTISCLDTNTEVSFFISQRDAESGAGQVMILHPGLVPSHIVAAQIKGPDDNGNFFVDSERAFADTLIVNEDGSNNLGLDCELFDF